jgi:SAM-dependent methyltransferase
MNQIMQENNGDPGQPPSLNEAYWDARYREGQTGWDLREVSPPIKAYIDQLINKDLRILIPGCGSGHEAAYLLDMGFSNITVIDIAPTIVKALQKRFSDNPQVKIVLGDFFEHNGTYDLILEQTFFCALPPSRRKEYVTKMKALLRPGGKLTGLLFNRNFEQEGPPFGGEKQAYEKLFSQEFNIRNLDSCYNSFEKRAGSELFFLMEQKAS